MFKRTTLSLVAIGVLLTFAASIEVQHEGIASAAVLFASVILGAWLKVSKRLDDKDPE